MEKDYIVLFIQSKGSTHAIFPHPQKKKKKEERLGKCAKIVSVHSKGLICEKLNRAYIYPLYVSKLACYKF